MKKARKSKFVIGGVALLSCVALAGVGYSSWVITSTVTSQTGNVTVTASAVEDDRITISDITTNSDSYSFGPSGSGTYISASGTSEEDLSVEFSFDVSCAGSMTFSALTKGYDITLALASNKTYSEGTVSDLGDNTYSASADALTYATSTTVTGTDSEASGTYLTAPADSLIGTTGITIATVSSTGVTAESSLGSGLEVSVTDGGTGSNSATVTVTAAFGWGDYFGSENPVNLSDDTKLDDYIEGLEWLYNAFNNAQFTYTVGGTVQAE